MQHVAVWHERMGLSPEEIMDQHPGLTLAEVYAALSFYWDYRELIDSAIETSREFADELRSGAASILDKLKDSIGKDISISS